MLVLKPSSFGGLFDPAGFLIWITALTDADEFLIVCYRNLHYVLAYKIYLLTAARSNASLLRGCTVLPRACQSYSSPTLSDLYFCTLKHPHTPNPKRREALWRHIRYTADVLYVAYVFRRCCTCPLSRHPSFWHMNLTCWAEVTEPNETVHSSSSSRSSSEQAFGKGQEETQHSCAIDFCEFAAACCHPHVMSRW